MFNKINKEFFFDECVLNLRSYQQELIASNIANSNTPHYHSKSIDFSKALDFLLKTQNKTSQNGLTLTSKKHISPTKVKDFEEYKNKIKQNYTIKNKSIEIDHEKVNFVKNSLLYQIEIAFINSKFKNLMSVLKG
ncbi:MAG: flagellar basal body rod protein FlgB [Buchnera aphidicola (Nurudea shiraii)]